MATTIITKYGSGAPAASDVVRGELAVDTENGRLYTEDSGGSVVEIGLNPSGNVDVTGTVTADGANIDGAVTTGDITIDNDDTPTLNFKKDSSADILGTINVSTDAGSGGKMVFQTKRNGNTALDRMIIDDDGDISFYEDTGTTAKLFWDASAESLGIGTSSPESALDVLGASSNQLRLRTAATEEYQIGRNASTGLLDFYGSQTGFTGYTFGGVDGERLRINSDGELLLNTTGSVGGSQFETKTPSNKHARSIDTSTQISGSGERAVMSEGTVSVNTTSLGTVLSIPFYSQGSVWRRYIIEFMFSSGEYNDSANARCGTATVKLASLNFLSTISLLHSTGAVSSVGSSGMNLQITFSSGFTGGLNNYEGVQVYYKILGEVPSFVQMYNATLN